MPVGRYIVGVLLGVITLAPIIAGAVRLRARALPAWEGPPARVADAVLGVGLLVVALELAGVVGAFDRAGVFVACVAVGAVAWLAAARLATGVAAPMAAPPRGPPGLLRVANVVALAAVAVTGAAWLGWVVSAYRSGMVSVDTLWYHLPFAARFVQTGSILHLHYVDRDPVTVFYPDNSELFHALGLVLFRSDVLSPVINLAWAALALAAAWSIGRPYGRAPHCLIAVVLVLATPGLVDTQPSGAYDDIVGVALLLCAAALLVNGGLAAPVTATAAVAAGVAFGAKYQFIVPAVALGVGVVALSRRRRARQAMVWAGGLVVFGGYWYLRNGVVVGNPVPSVAHLGPVSLPSPHVSTPAFTVGRYLFNGAVWRAFYVPGLRDSLGRSWWALLALALAGSLGAAALDREPVHRVLGGVAAVGVFAFIVTPQFLGLPGLPLFFVDNVRYLAVPLALGLVLVPIHRLLRAPALGSAWIAVASAILVATVVDRTVWRSGFTLQPYPGPARGNGAILAGALLGGAILVVVPAIGWLRRRADPRVLVAGGATALAISGWFVAESYAHNRFSATAPLPRIYAWAQHVRNARIGVVGLDEQYPLYGPDDSNYVQYIGRPEPHSGFTSIATCRAWRAAVDRGHYRWLVLAPFGFPINAATKVAPEARWTLTSPNAKLVIREHATGDVPGETAILARVTGPLDAAGC